ncbi:MAG: carboxypeptidase M32, partial [Candidatus Thermoplasmatota archaeon]|nr:carboxypeptidase M32 [Candidatus Thermoplasmatota archaeon]
MGAYESLMAKQKDIETIGQISGLLGWDQEVMMPPKAAPLRAEQMAWLSKTRHRLMIDPEMGELLAQAEKEDDGTDSVRAGNLRLMRDAYDKATKQSSEFVERMARHKSKSIISWTEAREKNDFSIFRDDLATMIELVRELADLLGYENEKYDALLDLYESGLTVARLDPLFAGLRD